jgi:hypothetical protein
MAAENIKKEEAIQAALKAEGLEEVLEKAKHPHHGRFSDAIWYDPDFCTPIIGGAGGIGSWLTVLLSRAGYNLIIYDFDTYDQTNMAGQLAKESAIGTNKAVAVIALAKELGATGRLMPQSTYTETSMASNVMFAGFDSIAARRLMFDKWMESLASRPTIPHLFVDGRMLAEAMQVYIVQPTPEQIEAYKATLFDDSEVQEQPCSMKATSHCGAAIASTMMSVFTNWVANCKADADIREVPFMITCEIPLLNWTPVTFDEYAAVCRVSAT